MLQKKPKAKLKDLISKDELLQLLGDGLKKMNTQEKLYNTYNKHTIFIDSSKNSTAANNNTMKANSNLLKASYNPIKAINNPLKTNNKPIKANKSKIEANNNPTKANNRPIKMPTRNSQQSLASKSDSQKLLKTFVRKLTNSAKIKPITAVRHSQSGKSVVNKNVSTKKPAPMELKQVFRDSDGESTEADSSGKFLSWRIFLPPYIPQSSEEQFLPAKYRSDSDENGSFRRLLQ